MSVFDSPCRYDVILGGDFLLKSGINFNYEHAWLEWHDGQLPFRDPAEFYEDEKNMLIDCLKAQEEEEGFGGDYFLTPEFSVAHLTLARQVIASALANLVETGWLEEEQAIDLAAAWLHNNPNTFYQLGLPPYGA